MNRLTAIALLTTVALGLFVGSAAAADATGVWKGDVKLPTGQMLPFVARLTQNGATITGTLDGIGGAPDVQIINGKIENDVVTFSGIRPVNDAPVKFNYSATFVDADTLDFTILRDDGSGPPLGSLTKRTKE